nr:putative ribonuclease H-like domain-containing protein [Tanacetum cinerariifolium]
DIDFLTNSMNYIPVFARNQTDKNAGPQDTNGNAGNQDNVNAGKEVPDQHYIVLPLWSSISFIFKNSDDKAADDKPKDDTGSNTAEELVNKENQAYRDKLDRLMSQENEASDAADALRKDNPVNAASTLGTFSAGRPSSPHPDAFIPANDLLHVDQNDSQILDLEDTAELRKADFNNMESSSVVSPIPTHRVHIDHPKDQILGDPKNKKDKKGIVVRNKAWLVVQGHIQEEGIDYDEVFAPVARIEAIRIFLAFASFMRFIVYQIDVKSAFLYGKIEEEVYVSQPPGLIDPQFLNKIHKVKKALYGLHQAPRAWYETLSTFLLQNRYRKGTIDKTLFIKNDKDDIMLVQVYVDDIIFGSTKKSLCDEFEALMHKIFQMSSMEEITFFLGLQVKQTTTPIEIQKPLVKDREAADVAIHLYRSMIRSLMYLTASRPDIMFAVKENQKKDKIGSKPDKNGRRGETGKSQKQLSR